jgi:hypothetical protein
VGDLSTGAGKLTPYMKPGPQEGMERPRSAAHARLSVAAKAYLAAPFEETQPTPQEQEAALTRHWAHLSSFPLQDTPGRATQLE